MTPLLNRTALSTPWLSVVVPVYNGEKVLGEALEGICSNECRAVEVIVIDDGSSDRSMAIAHSFRSRLPVIVVKRQRIRNWAANCNLGFRLASGDFVTILHQDDRWSPKRLETIREHLAQFPQADLISHPFGYIDSSGRKIGTMRGKFARTAGVIPTARVAEQLLIQNIFSCSSTVMRKQTLFDVGLMDESLWYAADWDLWLKLTARGTILNIPQELSEVRVHRASQTFLRSRMDNDLRGQMETVLTRHWRVWEKQLERPTRIKRLAKSSVDLNVALFSSWQRRWTRTNSAALVFSLARLGPVGWLRLWQRTYFWDRFFPRLRAVVAR